MDTRRMADTPQDERDGEYGTPSCPDEGKQLNHISPSTPVLGAASPGRMMQMKPPSHSMKAF